MPSNFSGNPYVAFVTILRREIVRLTRIWLQTTGPAVISTSLYFVIFGAFIGRRIGSMDGHLYIEYITPGIILMAIINNSYANVSSSFFGSKFQRNIEEMLIAPIPGFVILAGYVCGGIARGLLVGFIVMLVSVAFTGSYPENWLIVLLVAALTAALFSILGLINGIFADSFDDIYIVPTFVLSPLIYLGGVFYSISVLPDTWNFISQLNPVLYMVSAFRYGYIGTSDTDPVQAIIMLCVLSVLLSWLSLILLSKGTGLKK